MIAGVTHTKKKILSKKKIVLASRLEYDRILSVAQTGKEEGGLKVLCEEVRRSILADNVVIFKPNSQGTHYSGIVNGNSVTISAKSTVLSVVFHTGETISSKFGDQSFDPRIQQVLKMKIKAFQAGVLLDHLGNKQGILLIIRKRPEMLFEREISNLLSIFSLYIDRWVLWKEYQVEKDRCDHIISTCSEVLNTVTLQGFVEKLQYRLPKIFNCERGNILLFDYEKNNLFRRVNPSKYENFPIFHGLSGHCVNTKRPCICNDVFLERNFCKEMDDPLGENTKAIISVPLFSKVLPTIPEAVLQMINKLDGAHFNKSDEDLLVKFSSMITNCMIVLKFSQLSASLVEIIKRLEESLEKMAEDMSHRVYDFGSVRSSIVLFKSFFVKFLQ